MMSSNEDAVLNNKNVSITRVKRKKINASNFRANLELTILAVPVIVILFLFNYLPMVGISLAFKDLDYSSGMWGGSFNGFNNFKYFFTSQDAWRLTRNTVGYSLTFIAMGIICSAIIALLLYEVQSKALSKFYQTAMILPRFLSWVIVAYISYIFLSPTEGVLNQILQFLHLQPIMYYSESSYWPFILLFFNIWKGIGMECIMFYAALMAIDSELFEAATIDGANKLQKIIHISIPSIAPLAIIIGLLGLGNVFRGDFGLFYQIPRNVPLLYETTDVIDTYLYRGLKSGDYNATTAVGFFQSCVGMVTILAANAFVKKIAPERSLL